MRKLLQLFKNKFEDRAYAAEEKLLWWEEHVRWFQEKLQQKFLFFIVEYNQEPCGYIRFSGNMGWVDVSIAISPEARGKKVAFIGLQRVCRRFFVQERAVLGIRALVKITNQPSIKLFERAGFIRHADEQHKADYAGPDDECLSAQLHFLRKNCHFASPPS